MTNQHPIVPPPELIQKWSSEARSEILATQHLCTQAAQWGADQQLEADCEWLTAQCLHLEGPYLRSVMRPNPPSDKEQALNALSLIMSRQKGIFDGKPFNMIRKVLEALPND